MISAKHTPSHLSASQLATYGDCPRKWWFAKVAGLPQKSSASADLGKAIHASLEQWARAKTEPVSRFLSSQHMQVVEPALRAGLLPNPHTFEPEVEISLPDFPLPVVGFIDVLYYDGSILDYKTTGSLDWALNEEGLRQSWQALLYGVWSIRRNPQQQTLTFAHLYMATRKPHGARLVQIEWTRQELEERYSAAKTYALTMVRTGAIDVAHRVPTNVKSCRKYGGCPFLDYCDRQEVSMDIVSKIAARKKAVLQQRQEEDKPSQQINPPDGVTQEQAQAEQSVEIEAEQAKKRPKKVESEEALPTPTVGEKGSIVFVGCMPLQPLDEPIVWLHDVLGSLMEEVAQEHGVAHYGVLTYGKGKTAIAAKLAEQVKVVGVPRYLCVDPRMPAQSACIEVLLPYYQTVVERYG